jgi:hypothetical protein
MSIHPMDVGTVGENNGNKDPCDRRRLAIYMIHQREGGKDGQKVSRQRKSTNGAVDRPKPTTAYMLVTTGSS